MFFGPFQPSFTYTSTMLRTKQLVLVFLPASVACVCLLGGDPDGSTNTDPLPRQGIITTARALEFDIVQRNCALYLAMRSRAFAAPLEFGREADDALLHLNVCPEGNKVACATVSTPNSDTLLVGIPWWH